MGEGEIKTKQQVCDESFQTFVERGLLSETGDDILLKGSSKTMGELLTNKVIGPDSAKTRSGRVGFPNYYKYPLSRITDAYIQSKAAGFADMLCPVQHSKFNSIFFYPIIDSEAHQTILNDFAPETEHPLPLGKILATDSEYKSGYEKNKALGRKSSFGKVIDKLLEVAEGPHQAQTRPPSFEMLSDEAKEADDQRELKLWLQPDILLYPQEAEDLAVFLGAVGDKADKVKIVEPAGANGQIKIAIHSFLLRENKHKLRRLFVKLTNYDITGDKLSREDYHRALYLYEKCFVTLLTPAELGMSAELQFNLNDWNSYPDAAFGNVPRAVAIKEIEAILEEILEKGLPDLNEVPQAAGDWFIAAHDGVTHTGAVDTETASFTIREIAYWTWVERRLGPNASSEGLHLYENPEGMPVFAVSEPKLAAKLEVDYISYGDWPVARITLTKKDPNKAIMDPNDRVEVGFNRSNHFSLWKTMGGNLKLHFGSDEIKNDEAEARSLFLVERFKNLLNRLRDDGWGHTIYHDTPSGGAWAAGHDIKNFVFGALGLWAFNYWRNRPKPPGPRGPTGIPQLDAGRQSVEKAAQTAAETTKRVSELFGIRITQETIKAGMAFTITATVIGGLAVAARFSGRRLSGAMAVTGVGLLAAGGTLLAGEGVAWAGEKASEELTQPEVVTKAEIVNLKEARARGEKVISLPELREQMPWAARVVEAKIETAVQTVQVVQGAYEVVKGTFSSVTEPVGNFLSFFSKK